MIEAWIPSEKGDHMVVTAASVNHCEPDIKDSCHDLSTYAK
jgi:hypothetical protein